MDNLSKLDLAEPVLNDSLNVCKLLPGEIPQEVESCFAIDVNIAVGAIGGGIPAIFRHMRMWLAVCEPSWAHLNGRHTFELPPISLFVNTADIGALGHLDHLVIGHPRDVIADLHNASSAASGFELAKLVTNIRLIVLADTSFLAIVFFVAHISEKD